MRNAKLAGSAHLLGMAFLAALVVLAAGCGGDGGSSPPYTLELRTPAAATDVQVGDAVSVTYVDNDPGGTAATDIYADVDGNLSTTGDQHAIATGRAANNGTEQTVQWDTTGVPTGTYRIVGVTSDGTNGSVTDSCPGTVTLHDVWPMDHSNIVLRDQQGNALAAASTTPYSPRETCGACHDVDEITNGYHFQQGRTDDLGTIVTKNDYFGDGRDWLKSAGMYGKW